MKNKFL